MMKHLSIQAFSIFGFAALSKAQSQSAAAQSWWLQTMTGDFVPFVAYATTDVTDYFQYPATLLGSSGSESTYGVSCYAEMTSLCFADTGFTSMTLVTGPETMEIFFSQDSVYVTTGCALTGSPFPTTGTCSETYSWSNATSTITDSSSYTVPITTTSTLDIGSMWWSEDIYTATLAVVQGAAATTTGAEATRTISGKSSITPTVTSRATVSGKGSNTVTQGSGSASGSSSATKNAAGITTGLPKWALIAGVVMRALLSIL